MNHIDIADFNHDTADAEISIITPRQKLLKAQMLDVSLMERDCDLNQNFDRNNRDLPSALSYEVAFY